MNAGGSAPLAPMRRVAAAVFLPFTAAYTLSYLYRSVNAVIAPDLVPAFALTPSELGLACATMAGFPRWGNLAGWLAREARPTARSH
jgi:hypothetical protein